MLAYKAGMRSPVHHATLRGVGPDGEELTDDDIVEVDGESPPPSRVRYAIVTVPPPSSGRPPARVSGEYRIVMGTARRRTMRGMGQES